jgi:hypothetical protein
MSKNNKRNSPVRVILVQMHDEGQSRVQFRIQKFMNAISVETIVGNRKKLYVGDTIDEAVANDLAKAYEVTVTEKLSR